jgi:hypothetical protein
MLPADNRPATSWVHYTKSCNTQSSAPEDGQNDCPKRVEPTGIINKPLLLHLVGCLYYLYQWCTVKQISANGIYLLIKYIKRVLWRVAKRLSYIEDSRCLKVNISFLIKQYIFFFYVANTIRGLNFHRSYTLRVLSRKIFGRTWFIFLISFSFRHNFHSVRKDPYRHLFQYGSTYLHTQ